MMLLLGTPIDELETHAGGGYWVAYHLDALVHNHLAHLGLVHVNLQ